MRARVAEATAPCRVDLAGGAPGGPVLAVALDRRVSCRVETGPFGVELESRDALRRASAPDLSALPEVPSLRLAALVLRAFDLTTGVRVATHSPLPAGTGLGDEGALAVALAGAVATALGRKAPPEEIGRIATEVTRRAGSIASGGGAEAAAVCGGVVSVDDGRKDAMVEVLRVDPACVEESLLLVDTGSAADAGPPASADSVRSLRAALLEDRLEDVVGLWAEEWRAGRETVPGWPAPEAARVADLVESAGGAARLCGAGRGRVLAVWAPPGRRGAGRREAVQAALRSAGLRLFAGRVDLRGLDVECGERAIMSGLAR
ncbi:MAG TPA: hypothetical protein VL691_01820 [Vicinamibacteria bacterium]|nr:hypothetical protein [Vicinamibacteria bacterium]